ncbi:hypothetical protein [Streptomyces sp. NPDC001380]|uniref:hypothetical protein n=1 Tax=Streptomyces sp. NPDC001380 TaxID=3364566 RepID=UPI0036BB7978
MIAIITELELLHQKLKSGEWVPSDAEQSAARQICRAPALSHESVRDALEFTGLSKGLLFSVLEPTATVLELPAVHEDESRRRLEQGMWALLTHIRGQRGATQ